MDCFSLENKVILVTGASSGIGRATAIECSNRGATVYLTARNLENLQKTLELMRPGNHKIIPADLTINADIENLVNNVEKLDGVVLVAGINDKSIIKALNSEYIERILSINFNGPALLIKNLLKRKKIDKLGSIVFMSSISAFYPSVSNALYAASKAALNQFAKVLALEVLPIKARVNCIQPAFVETEMIHKYPLDVIDKIRENYPLGRFATPKEVANLVVFYLSDATQLVTGTSLVIDGGFTLQK